MTTTVNGVGNTISDLSWTNETFDLGGNNTTFNGTGTLDMLANSETVNLAAAAVAAIDGDGGNTFDLLGTTATVTASNNIFDMGATGETLNFQTGSETDTVDTAVGGDYIDLAANDSATVANSGDSIIIGGTGINVTGTADTIFANGNYDSGVTTTVNGVGNTISDLSWTNETFDLGGNNTTFNGTGTLDMLANSETVNLAAAAVAAIDGDGGNTFDLLGTTATVTASNNIFDMGATGETLNFQTGSETDTVDTAVGGDYIDLAANDSATVANSGDSIIIGGAGINVTGMGDTIYAVDDADSGVTTTVNGVGNTISDTYWTNETFDLGGNNTTFTGNGTLDMLASSETVNLAAAALAMINGDTGNTFDLLGTSATVTASNNIFDMSTSGEDLVFQSGSNGDIVDTTAGGDTVNLAANDSTTVANSGDSIIIGGAGINVTGMGDTIYAVGDADSGVTTTVNGIGNTISDTYWTNETFDLGGNNTTFTGNGTLDMLANSETVNLAASTLATIDGDGGNTFNLTVGGDTIDTSGTASGNMINISGTGADSETGSNNTTDLSAPGETLDLNGGTGETVNAAAGGDTIGLGVNVAATVANGGNTIDIDGSGVNLTATEDEIIANNSYDSGATTNIEGFGNSITSTTWTNETFDLGGNNTTFTGTGTLDMLSSSETVNLAASTLATIDGDTGNTINLAAGADTVNTSGNMINISGSGSDSENGSNNTTNLSTQGETLNLSGTGDTVNLTAGADTVNTSGNVINISGMGSDSENGSNNTINLSTQGETLNLSGAGNTVNAATGGDTIDLGALAAATIDGAGGNTINLTNATDSLIVNSSGNTVNAVTGDNITISGSHDAVYLNDADITVTSGSDVSIIGSGNTISAGSNDNIILSGSDDGISGGSYDNFDVSGTYNTIAATDSSADWYTGGYAGDTMSGTDDTSGYSSGGGGSYGSYGFSGNQKTIKTALGQDIGTIAQQDFAVGDLAAANAAEAALQQVNTVASMSPQTPGAGSAVLEGAQWDSQVVTWSLADSPGTAASPFSSYMDSSEVAEVQQAFSTWGAASGITFEEVSDSSQSDIRIGWGDFDTANTGIIGYTSFQTQAGQIQPDTIIRLEDPSQDALTTDSAGQQTYAGTDATLSQVLLHEIGHALGLASNADPNSVMYYDLTSNNQTLDATDIAGIQSLYGPGQTGINVSGSTNVNQLIQAMASFGSQAPGQTYQLAATQPIVQSPLLAASN